MRIVVVDFSVKTLLQRHQKLEPMNSRKKLIGRLLGCIDKGLEAARGIGTQIFGVGIAAPDIIELPSVIVTGELWQTELCKTTTSVSLLDQHVLESPELSHFDDISAYLPNLTTTGGTARSRYIQIRCIGENSQFEGETPDSAVVFLVEDMDFTGLGSVGSLFRRKAGREVLGGPQAGAFGANAAGGLIRIGKRESHPVLDREGVDEHRR